jgi:hypothetical protein
MYNILILDLNKDIKNCINSLFDKKNFKLIYSNANCAFLKMNDSSYINIWITFNLYDKHNLMTYSKFDKCYIYVSYKETNTMIQDLNNAYDQLSSKTHSINMITKIKKGMENIVLKKKLLIWCIEKVPFVELKHNESIKEALL